MVFAPRAAITRRSKPKATPTDGGRPLLHRRQQPALLGQRRLAVGKPLGIGPRVPRPQFGRIEQFVVAVGDFDAADVKLESLGHRRLASVMPDAGQRRLAGRVVVKQRRPLLAQVRLDSLDQQADRASRRGLRSKGLPAMRRPVSRRPPPVARRRRCADRCRRNGRMLHGS